MSKPWHMASVRQRQPVRKYRAVGPVGDDGMNRVSSMPPGIYRVLRHGALQDVVVTARGQAIERCEPETCPECRHHVCSCPEPEMPPCPPCPECGHLHRLGGCSLCQCSLWDKPGALRRYNELLAQQHYRVLEKRHEAERERRGS